MPYIKKSKRYNMDKIVKLMIEQDVKGDGDLNYILFKFCKEKIKPGYQNYRNFIAELNECGEEIRRRFLTEYENKKIEENGDV
jgi:hypothetical protein